MLHSINAQPVNLKAVSCIPVNPMGQLTGIIRDQIFDPVVPNCLNRGQLRIEVWEGYGSITKPAILNVSLIVVVAD